MNPMDKRGVGFYNPAPADFWPSANLGAECNGS
jgi:hypothetical protein